MVYKHLHRLMTHCAKKRLIEHTAIDDDRQLPYIGAGGRTRTDMVSRRILSAVRLPFRHTGVSNQDYYTQNDIENQPLFEISIMVYNMGYSLWRGGGSMQNAEEMRLVRAAAGGDVNAFEQLMRQHEGKMYAVALRMCANREDAQDCMQEAMIRAYRAIENFRFQSSFATWVYRITMNTCLDELRRRKVRQATSLDAMLDVGWSPAGGDSPEGKALAGERKRELEKAIHSLPEDMRAAIILRDIQGYAYDEIANILDVNVGTIKSRISRGREKLREILADKMELFNRDKV